MDTYVRHAELSANGYVEVTCPRDAHDGRTAWVFIHGLGGSHQVMVPLRDQVAGRHITLAPDLAGLGRSQNMLPATLQSWVDQVRALIDANGPFDRLVLVGHSMGTLIARHLAAGAACVEGLLLWGAVAAPDEQRRTVYTARGTHAAAFGMARLADDYVIPTLSQRTRELDAGAVAAVRNQLLAQQPRSYERACSALAAATEAEPPRNPRCFTVWASGAEDPLSTAAELATCARALGPRQSQTVILPSVGHWPIQEAPQACIRIQADHFGRLLSPTQP